MTWIFTRCPLTLSAGTPGILIIYYVKIIRKLHSQLSWLYDNFYSYRFPVKPTDIVIVVLLLFQDSPLVSFRPSQTVYANTAYADYRNVKRQRLKTGFIQCSVIQIAWEGNQWVNSSSYREAITVLFSGEMYPKILQWF